MQHVNDDMDELFRRAAENYPLDIQSADWNKVLAAMKGEAVASTVSEEKRNKYGRLFWPLLLLPFGLICNQFYSPEILSIKKDSQAAVQNQIFRSIIEKVQQQNTDDNAITSEIAIITNPGEKNVAGKNGTVNSIGVSSIHNLTKAFDPATVDFNKQTKENSSGNLFADDLRKNQNEIDDFTSDVNLNHRNYDSEIEFSKALGGVMSNFQNRKFDPLFNSSDGNSKPSVPVTRRKKLYVGMMGGVDATTIKFQKIENTGATYGLLFGYQFDEKWSIESGAFVEKKYYYTEGKYFNTSKLSIPASWKIENVSGNCKMIEVPVSLKLNFSPHKNYNWFATAGSSSYFMKKQSYTYKYYYGSGGPYSRSISYDTSVNYFSSNLSLSIGFSHRLGNLGDLRIEPYLKVPVSKVGFGSMPLFSTGLRIGITRRF